jgi:methylmalonyl-CoA mutase
LGASASLFPAYTEADWRKAAEAALHRASIETLQSTTTDGIKIEPVYRPAEGPRAVGPDGHWRVVARLDHPDPGEANAQALDDLANGADGLQVVFSGALGAHGYGLRRFDPATLHRAFDAVRFDTSAHFELDLGREGPRQALAFAALIERAGVGPADCTVSFGLDPLAASTRGPFPADWTAQAAPYLESALKLHSLGFRGPLMAADARGVHAAGGSPAQELAFALAAAVSLLRLLEAAGPPPAEARALIAFRLAADADQFVTLSKFRALRILWSRVADACGLDPVAAHVHAESAWRMMTARDPYVNVMRGAMAAFSAGLGGADSVSVLPHTLAVGLPDSLARRLARNAQLILLRESNLAFVADPAAGAGAFEALSGALCERSWALFQEIEGEGGLPSALGDGAFQRHVAESAAALTRDAARVKPPITGVSAHADLAEPPVEVAVGAPEREALTPVAGALAPFRLAEAFERLRDKSDAIVHETGSRPRVFVATLGPEPDHRGRVAYIREWLAAGGFEAVYDGTTTTAEEAVQRLRTSGAALVCLVGDEKAYAAQAEAFAGFMKASGVNGLTLEGRPGDREAQWRAAGVDDFIFPGRDAVAALDGLYRRIEKRRELTTS